VKLFSHGIAGNFRRAASDDTADFAFAMNIEKLEGAFPTHGVLLRKGLSTDHTDKNTSCIQICAAL
jgi:hypothetical protein